MRTLPQNPITIACAQAQPVAGDIVGNIELAAKMIAQAAQGGARLVLFPEKFLSGYEPDLIASNPRHYAITDHDPRLAPITAACRQHQITALIGAATMEQGRFYISSLIVDHRGTLRGLYHKQFLFAPERMFYSAGNTGIAIDLGEWRFGLAICYDTGFPEHARTADLNGCHAYLAGALFSQGNGFHERSVWLPARAFDNGMFCALSNHVGITGGWHACGAGGIWSPYGRLLAEGSDHDAEIILATLDPKELHKSTILSDFVLYARQPEAPYRIIDLNNTVQTKTAFF